MQKNSLYLLCIIVIFLLTLSGVRLLNSNQSSNSKNIKNLSPETATEEKQIVPITYDPINKFTKKDNELYYLDRPFSSYFSGKYIDTLNKIDIETAEILGRGYMRDQDSVYYFLSRSRTDQYDGSIQIVTGADAGSFFILHSKGFCDRNFSDAADNTYTYLMGKRNYQRVGKLPPCEIYKKITPDYKKPRLD